MISIFVLEDDFLQQGRLETTIAAIMKEKNWSYKELTIFGKPQQLIDAIPEKGSHQIFFLDIEIKKEEKKGLEVANQIRQHNPSAVIVFVTTHTEFMPITFRYQVAALDFIDKTLDDRQFSDRIASAIEYTLESLGSRACEDAFLFESAMARVQVPFHKILYFESSPTVHKVILHTTDERIEFYAGLSDLEKADPRLYQCHRSFVVNPENITKVDKVERVAIFENQGTAQSPGCPAASVSNHPEAITRKSITRKGGFHLYVDFYEHDLFQNSRHYVALQAHQPESFPSLYLPSGSAPLLPVILPPSSCRLLRLLCLFHPLQFLPAFRTAYQFQTF